MTTEPIADVPAGTAISDDDCVVAAVRACQRAVNGAAVNQVSIVRHLRKNRMNVGITYVTLPDILRDLVRARRLNVTNGLYWVALLLMLFGCSSDFASAGTGDPAGVAGSAGAAGALTIAGSSGIAGAAGETGGSDVAGASGQPSGGSAGAEAGSSGTAGAAGETGGSDVAGASGQPSGGSAGAAVGGTTAAVAAGSAGSAGRPVSIGTGGSPVVPTCPPCAPDVCGNCTDARHPSCVDPVYQYCF